jgi:hypothetical protein
LRLAAEGMHTQAFTGVAPDLQTLLERSALAPLALAGREPDGRPG